MSNLEHYFENLLFNGKDVNDNCNKDSLSKEQQSAVETCAEYVIDNLFYNRDIFLKFTRGKNIFLEDKS